MSKLGEITVNGHQVSVFRPPHSEPDFPWVDVAQLAQAYLGDDGSQHVVAMARQFGADKRAYAVAKNEDGIATIVCHALGQGLCRMVDHKNGWRGEADDGPAHREYCLAFGVFAADHWSMSIEDIVHAFHNPGGEFLRQNLRHRDGGAK
jgi:hypothetical protein